MSCTAKSIALAVMVVMVGCAGAGSATRDVVTYPDSGLPVDVAVVEVGVVDVGALDAGPG